MPPFLALTPPLVPLHTQDFLTLVSLILSEVQDTHSRLVSQSYSSCHHKKQLFWLNAENSTRVRTDGRERGLLKQLCHQNIQITVWKTVNSKSFSLPQHHTYSSQSNIFHTFVFKANKTVRFKVETDIYTADTEFNQFLDLSQKVLGSAGRSATGGCMQSIPQHCLSSMAPSASQKAAKYYYKKNLSIISIPKNCQYQLKFKTKSRLFLFL